MAKYFLGFLLLVGFVMAQAQPYTPSTVQQLDQLEQNRIILSKELEVANLQGQLQKANEAVGVATNPTGVGAALRLIKISGLASKPEAVFLYGGFRVTASKGGMVIPNVQLVSLTQSYAVLRDITSSKESILWLSAQEKTAQTTGTPGTIPQPR